MRYLILLCLLAVGCDQSTTVEGNLLVRRNSAETASRIEEIKYDGCDYLIIRVHNGYSIAHKGNCVRCSLVVRDK